MKNYTDNDKHINLLKEKRQDLLNSLKNLPNTQFKSVFRKLRYIDKQLIELYQDIEKEPSLGELFDNYLLSNIEKGVRYED